MKTTNTTRSIDFVTTETAISFNSVNISYMHSTELNALGEQCLGMTNATEKSEGYNIPSTATLILLTALFSMFAFVGNVGVIIAIKQDRVIIKHRQSLNLLSLAVADALLVMLVVPFSLVNEILGYWPFGDMYCRIYLSVDVLLCTASIWNICCIAVDRFVSVMYPLMHRQYRTTSRIRLALVSVWIFATAVSLLSFLAQSNIKSGQGSSCFVNDSTWYIILSTSLSFFLPAFITIPIYIKIFLIAKHSTTSKSGCLSPRMLSSGVWTISTHNAPTDHTSRESRFVFVISLVTGCFLICWSPFFVTYIIYSICRESCCINPVMFKAFFWIGYLNSAINPILYTIFNKDFRMAFKRLLYFSMRPMNIGSY